MDDILYYKFDDETHGIELWRSDGTESGTWIVIRMRHPVVRVHFLAAILPDSQMDG